MTYYPHQVAVDPGLLHGQFILTTREEILPRGWKVLQHGRWTLAYNSPLECVPVRDPAGRSIGWVLGDAITVDGRFLHPRTHPALVAQPGQTFVEIMDGLYGRCLGVDLAGPDPVVHPDCTASLAAVFSPVEEAVASTGSVIPATTRTPFAVDWILATDIPYSDAMYPLGLTPRRGVERILPNHVLDLGNWQHRRRWPVAMWRRDATPDIAVRLVHDTIRSAYRAVQEVLDLDLGLTAGLDSRLMLACARGLAGMTTYTTSIGDESSRCDIRVASDIARRAEVPHRVLGRRRTGRRQLRAWVARTAGEAGEPRGWAACATLEKEWNGCATISGGLADFSRITGFRKQFLEKPIAPRDIIRRCGVPLLPDFLRRADEWLVALPSLDSLAVGDLVQLEQRFGCWNSVTKYAELGRSSARLSPVNSRVAIETSARLPVDYRLAFRLHHDTIGAVWPELLEFPVNECRISPIHRRVFALRRDVLKAFARPAKAWRRIQGKRV